MRTRGLLNLDDETDELENDCPFRCTSEGTPGVSLCYIYHDAAKTECATYGRTVEEVTESVGSTTAS